MLLSTVTFKRKPDWSDLCSQQPAPKIFHPYWSMMTHVVITYKTTCQAMAEEPLHSLLQCKWQWDRIYVGKQYGPLSWQLVLTESMSGGIVLFFSIVVGWQIILVFVDTSFLWKLYQISSGKKKIFCRALSNTLVVIEMQPLRLSGSAARSPPSLETFQWRYGLRHC